MVPATEILIVDDEVGIRELLSEILQDEGYRVSVAENATEARSYRSRQQPALASMKIFMLSGANELWDAQIAAKLGADHYLEKFPAPAELHELLASVCSAPARATAS